MGEFLKEDHLLEKDGKANPDYTKIEISNSFWELCGTFKEEIFAMEQ